MHCVTLLINSLFLVLAKQIFACAETANSIIPLCKLQRILSVTKLHRQFTASSVATVAIRAQFDFNIVQLSTAIRLPMSACYAWVL